MWQTSPIFPVKDTSQDPTLEYCKGVTSLLWFLRWDSNGMWSTESMVVYLISACKPHQWRSQDFTSGGNFRGTFTGLITDTNQYEPTTYVNQKYQQVCEFCPLATPLNPIVSPYFCEIVSSFNLRPSACCCTPPPPPPPTSKRADAILWCRCGPST